MFGAIARRCLLSCWANPSELLERNADTWYRDDTQETLVIELDQGDQRYATDVGRQQRCWALFVMYLVSNEWECNLLRISRELVLRSAIGHRSLHEVPLGFLKHALLAYLADNTFCDHDSSRIVGLHVLNVPIGTASTPLQFFICDSKADETRRTQHQVLALFTRDNPNQPDEDQPRDDPDVVSFSESIKWRLQLNICARCGGDYYCGCKWKTRHNISASDEQRSLLVFIDSHLPRLPIGILRAANSFRLRLNYVKSQRTQLNAFEVRVIGFSTITPIVEPPYAMFTLEIRHGELLWRIARRYNHFVSLHSQLETVVPSGVLPTLPPKRWMPRLERNYLLCRQIVLRNYLRSLLMIDEVETSVPLLSFLGALSTTFEDQTTIDSSRREVIHLRVLSYHVAPGDVLLFHCRGPVTRAQRSVTGSEWDHVALVIPGSATVKLKLLEATGDGVVTSPMTSRILSYATYHIDYVAVRKLRTPLITNAARNDLLLRFVETVEGLPYALTLPKVLSTRSSHSLPDDYFCSELVAEAYKALGIIDGGIRSSSFWPGSFSSGGSIDTELNRHGASLDREQLVDCRLLEVAMASTST